LIARTIKARFLVALCFVTFCGQTQEGEKLIDDINAAKVKARRLADDAERKRSEAREKNQAEHGRLIEEAAKFYGQAADTLKEAARNAQELAKVKSPSWYEEYFGLQSKLFNNLAQLATGAQAELIVRKNGPPSESQLQIWKDNLERIRKEDEEFREKIASIESRQGVVLIKE